MLKIHQYYTTNKSLDKDYIRSKLPTETAQVFEQILNMEFPPSVTEVEMLCNDFDNFPNEKQIIMILSAERNLETVKALTTQKKATTKVKFERRDSND